MLKSSHLTRIAALAATAAAFVAAPAFAADGDLVSGFADDGRQTGDLGVDNPATAVAVQADGKVVVVGSAANGAGDIFVVRYDTDGTTDQSFNGKGWGTYSFGLGEFAEAVAIAPDGKIVVAGYTSLAGSTGNENNFAILRLTDKGQPDPGFAGGDGKATVDFGGDDRALGVAVQPDGSIVAGGGWAEGLIGGGITSNFALARLTPAGELDDTFDGEGKLGADFGGGSTEFVKSIALADNGDVVAAGYTSHGASGANTNDIAVLRVDSHGQPVGGFSGDGKQQVDFGYDDRGEGVAIQPDGKVVVAGKQDGGASDFAIVRLGGNGELDGSFSGDGKQNVFFGPDSGASSERAESVVAVDGGKIAVGGFTNSGSAPDQFAAVLLDDHGELDPSFSGDGRQTVDFDGGDDEAHGIAAHGDRLYLAGSSAPAASRKIAVAALAITPPASASTPAPEEPTETGSGSGSNSQPQAPAAPPVAPLAPADTTAPLLEGLKLKPKTFAARRGTKATWKLSEASKLSVRVERARSNGGFKAFARLTRKGVAGKNSLVLKRKVAGRKLRPGSYRLTLRATDGSGNSSKRARTKFVVKG